MQRHTTVYRVVTYDGAAPAYYHFVTKAEVKAFKRQWAQEAEDGATVPSVEFASRRMPVASPAPWMI